MTQLQLKWYQLNWVHPILWVPQFFEHYTSEHGNWYLLKEMDKGFTLFVLYLNLNKFFLAHIMEYVVAIILLN